MKVTITTSSDEIYDVEVSPNVNLENFKLFCQLEFGFPSVEGILIIHDGKVLQGEAKTLKQFGVHDGDVLMIQNMGKIPVDSSKHDFMYTSSTSKDNRVFRDPTTHTVAQQANNNPNKGFVSGHLNDPGYIRDLILSSPDQLALLKQNNPRLSDALNTGKLETFAKVLKEQMAEREKRKKQQIKLANADPFDKYAQRLIAEEIRQKNVEANMEAALEYNPETFGAVVMLYINCKVNGVPVKAFVDSGAQTTIMSAKCAERCNIIRLIDTRWAGVAKGVGVQQIIGRIHMVQVAIESDYLTTSFSILEEQPMDMLLGLDMLRRHQCCIDLRRNVLKIGTTGTETPFLSERDLPDCARLSTSSDDEDYL